MNLYELYEAEKDGQGVNGDKVHFHDPKTQQMYLKAVQSATWAENPTEALIQFISHAMDEAALEREELKKHSELLDKKDKELDKYDHIQDKHIERFDALAQDYEEKIGLIDKLNQTFDDRRKAMDNKMVEVDKQIETLQGYVERFKSLERKLDGKVNGITANRPSRQNIPQKAP